MKNIFAQAAALIAMAAISHSDTPKMDGEFDPSTWKSEPKKTPDELAIAAKYQAERLERKRIAFAKRQPKK